MQNQDDIENQNHFPAWDPTQPLESLEQLKQRAVAEAQGRIAWYARSKGGKKKGSKFIRFFAIVLGALGALCPLLDATLQNMREAPMRAKVDLGEFGYVLIAIAAGVLAYDRYFGLSTGWIRYMESELTIERLLKELEYDWALLRSELDPEDQEQRKVALGRLREFALAVEAVVEEETSAWATEFRSNLAALEKRLQKKAEERAPGSVKLSVPNAGNFDEVAVSVDGEEVQKLTQGTETVVRRLSPGAHTLVVIGRKDGETSTASKVVQVQAGIVASVSLPIPGEN